MNRDTPSLAHVPAHAGPHSDDDEATLAYIESNVYLVFTIIQLLVGLFGNAIFIGSVLSFKNLRSVNNIFIANLVLADCVSLVLLDAFSILGIIKRGDGILHYGSRFCKVISYFYISAMVCSVWSLASCAVHIYIRVCHKGLYEAVYNAQSVSVIVFWIWTLCPMIVLPSMMGWGSHGYDTRLMHCTFDYTASYAFTFFLLAMGAWIPFIVVAYCTIRAVLFIRAQKTEVNPETTPEDAADVTNEDCQVEQPTPTRSHHNTRTLHAIMAVTLSLLIGWVTMTFIWLLDQEKQLGATKFVFATMVAHSPNSINGIVYAMANKTIRNHYLKKTCGRRCRMCRKVRLEQRTAPSGQENPTHEETL